MGNLGFKEITIHNWLQPDEVLSYFKKSRTNGTMEPVTGEDYLQSALAPKLLPVVPEDIHELFKVVRGAIVYGYFFYPLYTLAAEQLFRVAEAALAYKCERMGVPKSRRSFDKRIRWLVEIGFISNEEADMWDKISYYRNAASHPKTQKILGPQDALIILGIMAEQINSLFRKD
jgi:hypothetical protein